MNEVLDLLSEIWFVIIPAVLVVVQQIVKLTPTEKDNDYLKKVMIWIAKINEIIPNKKKGGGKHVTDVKNK